MKYNKICRAVFISRPNRFIAIVQLTNGSLETVHVKNTGRCKELLIPGVTVILEEGTNPARKTKYDLIAVYKEYKLTNGSYENYASGERLQRLCLEDDNKALDQEYKQLTNDSLYESIRLKSTVYINGLETNGSNGKESPAFNNRLTNGSLFGLKQEKLTNDCLLTELKTNGCLSKEKTFAGGNITNGSFQTNERKLINIDSQAPNKVTNEWLLVQGFDEVKPEYSYGESRIDFYMRKGNQDYLMEVKGCTLEDKGQGYFPDAPTERGVKHLHELTNGSKSGIKCYLTFVIQIDGVKSVLPNIKTHAEFGTALEEARKAGVTVVFLMCHVEEGELVWLQATV